MKDDKLGVFCAGMFTDITTIEECATAAQALNDTWDTGGGVAARDDGNDAKGNKPRGCYMLGSPHPGNWRSLEQNVKMTNSGGCTSSTTCFCKRSELPPPPSSPPLPPTSPLSGVSDPSECATDGSQCCAVLYKGEPTCDPVPIFDFASWQHPGGNIFPVSRLCGQVRTNWLVRSSSHGSCDSTQSCDPEADVQTLTGYGDSTATRVGTYTPPGCGSSGGGGRGEVANTTTWPLSPLELFICRVEEKLGGVVLLVDKASYDVDGSLACKYSSSRSSRPWILPNPPIVLSSPDPSLSQTFSTAEAPLSPLVNVAGAPDAFILTERPAACELSDDKPAYLSSGTLWVRHDPRVEMVLNTVDQPGGYSHVSQASVLDGSGIYVSRNADSYSDGWFEISDNVCHSNGIDGITVHATSRVALHGNVTRARPEPPTA